MQTYDVTTPQGLHIHLSISDWDTGYIFINDIYDERITIKFFTDMESAINFIRSYLYQDAFLLFNGCATITLLAGFEPDLLFGLKLKKVAGSILISWWRIAGSNR